MLTKGIICPSKSPWASPIFLVSKKDGTTRFWIDYRKVNSVTYIRCLPTSQGRWHPWHSNWISTIDLKSGHWQVEMQNEKTLRWLKERFYWPGHYTDVKKLVPILCQLFNYKTSTPTRQAPIGTVTASYPKQIIATDLVGPLPESDTGNRYILVVADYFTRYMEAFPLPNQEATTVARTLVDEIFWVEIFHIRATSLWSRQTIWRPVDHRSLQVIEHQQNQNHPLSSSMWCSSWKTILKSALYSYRKSWLNTVCLNYYNHLINMWLVYLF